MIGMIKAIFYKEWIKIRRFYPVCAVIVLGFTLFSVFRVDRVADFRGVEHIWEVLLEKDSVLIEMLQYFPLLCGILLAIVQFVPEMIQKRLKLTLHLPFPQNRMILLMLLAGAVALLLLFSIQIIIIYSYFRHILVSELTSRILLTSAPWFIAGMTAYFCTAWICLEPTWKWRIAEVLTATGLCRIYFLSQLPQAYDGMLIWLLTITAFTLMTPLLSIWRFRQGCQD